MGWNNILKGFTPPSPPEVKKDIMEEFGEAKELIEEMQALYLLNVIRANDKLINLVKAMKKKVAEKGEESFTEHDFKALNLTRKELVFAVRQFEEVSDSLNLTMEIVDGKG